MEFKITQDTNKINELKAQLYSKLTAPIDAMWELLYIASTKNYLIYSQEKNIGYCSIDNNHSLLQLFILDGFKAKMKTVVESLIEQKLIVSASLSSNEPIAFNTCLSLSKSIKPNTFCFEHTNSEVDVNSSLNLQLVSETDIPEIKSFLKEQIGMDDTFGYTENLVSRKEIYFIKEDNKIIATSECRWSDTQAEIADLGIIVNKNMQGKGIATQVLKLQANRVIQANRKPICSTTIDNIGSQKAIERAGFYCSNIIFDIQF
ncbi:GNAT family N-acetyltransferase [Polaribacter sargassicola]|uniref:GNAT family N-acetyltransferase n=1 Tax=Polaribacter sargassicola TaxID=2836891 RepID=UPI001F01EEFA|nr:GNAT family N-acetyltransferase [Polaribacter sp. DS7-9]MCG1037642.1 GNAT family N-acetyltransferase [Polaribacter sp. DS7-9]